MKIILLVLLTSFLTPFITTAQDFTGYGSITPEELALKECAFDKDANAVILLDEAESNYDDNSHLITNRHIRIKILKEKGFDAANIEIYFRRKDDVEAIYNLEAIITNVNAEGGVVTEKLSNKLFYKKTEDEYYGKMIFTFPNVKVGSIIEYKYQSFLKHYGWLHDWYFQNYLPVVKSRYWLRVVPHLEFTYRVSKKEDMPAIVKQEKGSELVYFEMNNIPGLDDEPYMDAREDYIQKVVFQVSGYNQSDGFGKKNYMTTWNEVIKELLSSNDFGQQLVKNIPGTKDVIDAIKNISSEEERMKKVYDYVRSNMSWNYRHGIQAIDGVKTPWEKHKGSSGEINLILINLLKDAGLEVYPALVSKRSHGRVDVNYPFIDQFNTVLACVQISSKKYYLDATDIYTPAHIIPNNILNTNALIVNKKNGGIVTIINDALQYDDYINAMTELDNNGKFSGEVYIKNDGYSRIKKVTDYKDAGQEKYVDKYFRKDNIAIDRFEFINLDKDSLPVEQKFKFSTNLPTANDYIFVPLNLFFEFEKNPFTSDNRFSNINFGYKKMINTYASITLPQGYDIDALPKPVKMTTPDNDIVFKRSVTYDKESNSVVCMFVFDFKKSLYTVDEYDILQQVYKKIFEFLKEPVVLKKK